MVDATQSLSTLLAHQAVTNADTAAGLSVVGTEVDVRSALSASVFVYHALIEAAANDPGAEYHLQVRGSVTAADDDDWVTAWVFKTRVDSALSTAINATEPIGETAIAVATDRSATAGFQEGQEIYLQDATLADSEWARVRHISATVITISGPLVNEKTSSGFVWSYAETFVGSVDLTGVSYMRMLFQNTDITGADVHIKADALILTAIE